MLLGALEFGIARALDATSSAREDPGASFVRRAWTRARRDYYMRHERHIVQYLPGCAAHDPDLGYRLEPGSCRFRNREYDIEIVVNSAGLRDSEAALASPRVVVTGDSFAMGWGVSADETLDAQLERIVGVPVLNAAQPSYGTAREVVLLREFDLSATDALVIQYCENDYVENARFVNGMGRLRTMPREKYDETVADHQAQTRYFPGRHAARLLPLWWRALRRGDDAPPAWVRDCELEAEAFLGVLRLAALPAAPLRVVVFEALYSAEERSCFARELEERVRSGAPLPVWVAELRVLDSKPLVDGADYYPLDEHLNASGYRKLARAIAALLLPDRS